MSEKMAPVQGYSAGIPWSMHLRAYDAYSKKWSPQPAMIDLEGRNCRGGFSVGELDDFIPGWREELSEIGRLKAERERLWDQLGQAQARIETDGRDLERLRAALKQIERIGWREGTKFGEWLVECRGIARSALEQREEGK